MVTIATPRISTSVGVSRIASAQANRSIIDVQYQEWITEQSSIHPDHPYPTLRHWTGQNSNGPRPAQDASGWCVASGLKYEAYSNAQRTILTTSLDDPIQGTSSQITSDELNCP